MLHVDIAHIFFIYIIFSDQTLSQIF